MNTTSRTLADELLLLALDDAKGSVHSAASLALDYGLAGAILMELAINNRLTIDGKHIAVADSTPLNHPVLDDALHAIEQSSKRRPAQDWVMRLPKAVGGLRQRLLDDLVMRGVLAQREDRILYIFPVTRYPEQQGAVEDDIRARIDRVLLEGGAADARTLLLIRLIKSCNLVSVLYERAQRKSVNVRIDQLIAQDVYSKAIDQAVVGAQAAINAAIVASTIAATTAATASCSAATSANC
jgi:Golgi phosphoprotein 3